ncbi:hypothetical protein [Paraburkholderia sp. EG304]|uniref:hypothetical protein n=1 Tax=Paraburkholderia sp. EG304 TaxID=3237015 RepID=UPI00397E739B
MLRRVELDIPKPGSGEVLVRVAAAGGNFMDIHTRHGQYRDSRSRVNPSPLVSLNDRLHNCVNQHAEVRRKGNQR